MMIIVPVGSGVQVMTPFAAAKTPRKTALTPATVFATESPRTFRLQCPTSRTLARAVKPSNSPFSTRHTANLQSTAFTIHHLESFRAEFYFLRPRIFSALPWKISSFSVLELSSESTSSFMKRICIGPCSGASVPKTT